MNYDEIIAEARENATSICLAQLGDVNAMADAEILAVLDRIGDDPNRLYALLRVLAGTVTALASSQFKRHADRAIRHAISDLKMSGQDRDE